MNAARTISRRFVDGSAPAARGGGPGDADPPPSDRPEILVRILLEYFFV